MKGILNESALFENGIVIVEAVAEEERLDKITKFYSPQPAIVTRGLLDFEAILSESSYWQLDPESQQIVNKNYPSARIPKPAHQERHWPRARQRYEKRYQIAHQDAKFDLAVDVTLRARDIQAAKEPRWSRLVKEDIFKTLIDSARSAEGQSVFRAKEDLERLRVEDEDDWNYGQIVLARTAPMAAPMLSHPRPDLYIALPIIHHSLPQRGFQNDDCIKNFTQGSLTELQKGGLDCNPIAPLTEEEMETPKIGNKKAKGEARWEDEESEGKDTKETEEIYTKSRLCEKHMVCFPCAVVEIKHHAVDERGTRKCYAQAANGASTSLALLNSLSRHSVHQGAFESIRPVVSFTFVGYQTRVWVTYITSAFEEIVDGYTLQRCTYEMQCIWKGDLRCEWDTLQLCCIVENLHFWVLRHFRPWVSSCLDGWNSKDINALQKAQEAEDEVLGRIEGREKIKSSTYIKAESRWKEGTEYLRATKYNAQESTAEDEEGLNEEYAATDYQDDDNNNDDNDGDNDEDETYRDDAANDDESEDSRGTNTHSDNNSASSSYGGTPTQPINYLRDDPYGKLDDEDAFASAFHSNDSPSRSTVLDRKPKTPKKGQQEHDRVNRTLGADLPIRDYRYRLRSRSVGI